MMMKFYCKPALTLALALFTSALTCPAQHVLLEAELFADLGGWDLDQQSMEQMGSPYLLAHGLGVPVKDATTTAKFGTPGKYRVWVRTRDWVAPWKDWASACSIRRPLPAGMADAHGSMGRRSCCGKTSLSR